MTRNCPIGALVVSPIAAHRVCIDKSARRSGSPTRRARIRAGTITATRDQCQGRRPRVDLISSASRSGWRISLEAEASPLASRTCRHRPSVSRRQVAWAVALDRAGVQFGARPFPRWTQGAHRISRPAQRGAGSAWHRAARVMTSTHRRMPSLNQGRRRRSRASGVFRLGETDRRPRAEESAGQSSAPVARTACDPRLR